VRRTLGQAPSCRLFNFGPGLEQAWTNFITFLPKLAIAAAILIAGYLLGRLAERVLDALLTRIGFDGLVDRAGMRKAMSRTRYRASTWVGKIAFYTIALFVLQFAFGIFGPNPISDLLTRVIAFLPSLFAAIIIIVVASAIASAVKGIVEAALGALSYGRIVANIAAIAIIATGIFAALNQINIAPAIVNGLFYTLLAVGGGSAIIAIGGGGIAPMRARWEKWLGHIEQEAPRWREQIRQRPARGPQQRDRQAPAARSSEQRSFPQ
jgi:hypothetical protein